ncbi:MAG: glycosyltransferase family 2 protein [Prevotella sp.]|nr:glycosyltransferase family 2 protein [Prevotella sp.]
MPKVSVLIPVYNTASYLGQCLDSLLAQTLSDIEIICVDDCSTDSSPSILQSYRQQDARVVVITSDQNMGLAKARNVALEHATGTFACMLDSDDWFSPDALEKAVEVFSKHEKADCVLFRFVLAFDHGQRLEDFPMQPFTVLSGSEACRLSLNWQIHGIYMTRTELHKKFPYDTASLLYSDENTTRIHYAASREVRCCDGIYYYRQHDMSMTHKVSVRRFDRLKARESLMRQLATMAPGFDYKSILTNQYWLDVVDLYMFHFVHGAELTPAERRYGLSEMRRAWLTIDRSLLSPAITRKLGYRPMARWWLFRVEEWLYFTLRGWLGKNS